MHNRGNNSLGSTFLSCTCSAQLSPVPSNTMTRALASPQSFHYVSLPLWGWLSKVCLKRLCVLETLTSLPSYCKLRNQKVPHYRRFLRFACHTEEDQFRSVTCSMCWISSKKGFLHTFSWMSNILRQCFSVLLFIGSKPAPISCAWTPLAVVEQQCYWMRLQYFLSEKCFPIAPALM